jgi:hypothetical protein
MSLQDFAKQLAEFYDEMVTVADEAVGGFAIDSMHPPIEKKKRKKDKDPLEEGEHPKRVLIDLDRTIHPYKRGWDEGKLEDPPFPEAKFAIDKLKSSGYEIVIFSTRASQENANTFKYNLEDEIKNIESYLKNNDIYFDRITGDKIAADFYIDDKAVHIKNGNWKDVLSQINKREKSLK